MGNIHFLVALNDSTIAHKNRSIVLPVALPLATFPFCIKREEGINATLNLGTIWNCTKTILFPNISKGDTFICATVLVYNTTSDNQTTIDYVFLANLTYSGTTASDYSGNLWGVGYHLATTPVGYKDSLKHAAK